MIKLFVIFLASLLYSLPSKAEIFLGINPQSTLGEIKKKFPNASFTPINAAWVTENDGFYEMKGNGIAGSYRLLFGDMRPSHKKQLVEAEKALKKSGVNTGSQMKVDVYRYLSTLSEDKALTVWGGRWIPSDPIPLERFISKYGKPDEVGYTDDDLQPFRAWKDRGLQVNLSDDEKFVLYVEYTYTKKDLKAACQLRHKDWGDACNYDYNFK